MGNNWLKSQIIHVFYRNVHQYEQENPYFCEEYKRRKTRFGSTYREQTLFKLHNRIMNTTEKSSPFAGMSNYRWVICAMLFLATTVNYMDRQVLSLTWKDFIAPEFDWTDENYGTITAYFSIIYAVCMLFVGKLIDFLGTRKGYLWAIGFWSTGACLHAFCGIATCGIVTGHWMVGFEEAKDLLRASNAIAMVSTVSVYLFLVARCILAIGESGNFPAAIKVTAEYFPKKDRAFSTAIFNSGAQIGALLAPFTIPIMARQFGWETAFIVIGALGYIWMGAWIFVYDKPRRKKQVNAAELAYIEQDSQSESENEGEADSKAEKDTEKISLWKFFTYRQTWAAIFAKFLPDGVWWFFLFWTPAYIKDVYGYSSDSWMGIMLIFVLYLISMLSIFGGRLTTTIIHKNQGNPYLGRTKAMLLFAFFPLLGLFAQPLGGTSPWFPIIIIGIIGAAHQSWSANAYSVGSDLFPKSAVATITGISGMAGGVGCFLLNWGSGKLFTYADQTQMQALGFQGKEAGYMIIFCICALAYLFSWFMVKILVPSYKPVRP